MSSVKYELDGRVAILTLNRPDSLNAVSPEMVDGLLEASARAARDAEARAVIVRGAGKSFMAGGDLRWFREQLALPAGQRQAKFAELIAGVHASILNFKRMEKPARRKRRMVRFPTANAQPPSRPPPRLLVRHSAPRSTGVHSFAKMHRFRI